MPTNETTTVVAETVAPLGAAADKQAATSNVAAPAKPAKRVTVKTGKRTAKPAAKPASKPGKPATIEAKPDPRAERATRIAADRGAVHALYASFEANRVSVPVKPLSAFKPATTTAHPIARNPSVRQAAAIAVLFASAKRTLRDGGSAPRVFDLNGVRSCAENGVLRDAVSSGLITVSGDTPETEIVTLARGSAKAIAGLIGERAIKAGKLA